MQQPLISIVLCTYNGEKFLQQQIDSLLQQTYPSIEWIIADDASTDGTKAILMQYAHLPNVQCIFNPYNLGYAKNFAQALTYASGDYIAFCDQDDIWMPNKIEALYAHIGDAALAYSNSLMVNEHGESLHKTLANISKMYTGNNSRGFIFWNVVWGHTLLIQKSWLQACLPIPDNAPHDIWIAFKATDMKGIVYVDKILTRYRQHAHTVTSSMYAKSGDAKKRTLQKRYQEFEQRLQWMQLLRHGVQQSEWPFYDELILLYEKKRKGYAWGLCWFMLKHYKDLYLFKKKKFKSIVIEILKECRREKAVL